MTLPKLYAILDADTCTRRDLSKREVAEAWLEAGVRLAQYRDKSAADAAFLENARGIRSSFDHAATLILNDRIHLLAQTQFDGVHIGQTDGAVATARRCIGSAAILGISTHNPAQLEDADTGPADYVAIGPVFATGTKLDAAHVVGLEGVRAARALTTKPLVAIGGIARENAAQVLAAGADSVAVISGLLPPAGTSYREIRQAAEDFLAALR